MTFRDFLKENIVFLDGSTGSLLQRYGLKNNEGTETWNIAQPGIVQQIQKDYFDAGSNVVVTNTFGASASKYADQSQLEKIVAAAFDNAKRARENSSGAQEKFIGFNIGPIGSLLEPFGDTSFEEAADIFSKNVRAGLKCHPDLIVIETMGDVYEAKAALIAVKENTDLPVIVTHTYGKNGRIMTGADPKSVVTIMEGLGADVVGVNCSYGPAQLRPIVQEYLKAASVPVSFKPNAGLPKEVNGRMAYDIDEETFAGIVREAVEDGVRLIGGCCGTTPEHIRRLHSAVQGCAPVPVEIKEEPVIASFSATGKPDEAEILSVEEDDSDYALAELVQEEQESSNDLFGIRTSSLSALEKALRVFNGKPLSDLSVFEAEEMKQALFLTKKYGSAVYLPKDNSIRGLTENDMEALLKESGIAKKDIIREI